MWTLLLHLQQQFQDFQRHFKKSGGFRHSLLATISDGRLGTTNQLILVLFTSQVKFLLQTPNPAVLYC